MIRLGRLHLINALDFVAKCFLGWLNNWFEQYMCVENCFFSCRQLQLLQDHSPCQDTRQQEVQHHAVPQRTPVRAWRMEESTHSLLQNQRLRGASGKITFFGKRHASKTRLTATAKPMTVNMHLPQYEPSNESQKSPKKNFRHMTVPFWCGVHQMWTV